jgi:hypothetical protein
MDRWVGEVTSTLRTCAEETVARRLLDTEIAFTSELAARDPAAAARSEIRPSAQ